MARHLQVEIDKLKKKTLTLFAIVEESVQKAMRSFDERNSELAREVIDSDPAIDAAEVDIEEECLKILALHQPVAVDLRFIVAVLKMNNDMERVGDLGINIAERALFLSEQEPIKVPIDLSPMRRKALNMLGDSLDALMKMDPKLARSVRTLDDEIDRMHREMYMQIGREMRVNPENIERLLSYLSVSRYLERIADYATNIAEDVIYLCEGEIVRHKQPSS
jgi:phosphate transport system protein